MSYTSRMWWCSGNVRTNADIRLSRASSVDDTTVTSVHGEGLGKSENYVGEIREPREALRMLVFSGGCAGLNYGMAIGFVKPDDYILEIDGHIIVVDPKSMSFLNRMQVDHYESIQSSGFKFNNPNAMTSCGCGLSFKTAQKTEMQKPKPCH